MVNYPGEAHTYLATFSGTATLHGLRHLLTDYHEQMDIPSGQQTSAIGFQGSTSHGVNLIEWQHDRPPLR